MGFLFSDTFKCIRPLKAHIQLHKWLQCSKLQLDSHVAVTLYKPILGTVYLQMPFRAFPMKDPPSCAS